MPDEKPEPCCFDCRHSKIAAKNGEGSCHRYPPVLVPPTVKAQAKHSQTDDEDDVSSLIAAAGEAWVWTFPVIACDDCCGEFAPKPGGAPCQ